MSDTAEDVISKVIENWNKHDLAALVALYAPDVVAWNPTRGEFKGREALERVLETAHKAFPDDQTLVRNAVIQSDRVAIEGTYTRTFAGVLELAGRTIQPTNKNYRLPFATFLRVDKDGLISEWRDYWDALSFLRQLGIMP